MGMNLEPWSELSSAGVCANLKAEFSAFDLELEGRDDSNSPKMTASRDTWRG